MTATGELSSFLAAINALSMVQSVRALIWPLDSAVAIKAAGEMSPGVRTEPLPERGDLIVRDLEAGGGRVAAVAD